MKNPFKKHSSAPGDTFEAEGLSFRSFDIDTDGPYYNKWRKDAWVCAHGSEQGYVYIYLSYAAVRALRNPESVRVALYEGRPCGIIELDLRRNAEKGSGWISFFYLTADMRGKGFGRALMAEAERIYKAKGRTGISLCAAESNRSALGFYRHLGFVKTDEEQGVLGPLFILEKEIE